MPGRWTLALRAGAVAYLVALLALAQFAAPAAAHGGFGHVHPDHVPIHVHSAAEIWPLAGPMGGNLTLEALPAPQRHPEWSPQHPDSTPQLGSWRSRAPPAPDR